MTAPRGQVIGTAGHGLSGDVSWATNQQVADIGRQGEQRTAQQLDKLAARPGGPTVIHDVKIPIAAITANIDHIVVAGDKVVLVDSKVWRPAFYWTVGRRTRRGLERFPHADGRTMDMAHKSLSKYLTARAPDAQLQRPLVAVWPSNASKPMRLWAASTPGALMLPGFQVIRRLSGRSLRRTANPRVVAALLPLVSSWADEYGNDGFAPVPTGQPTQMAPRDRFEDFNF